ncbi:MAG: energy transducer TonB [Proteobacteria bacterium]|nr:energy transducer TonB [Pseudomonadota bacterium]
MLASLRQSPLKTPEWQHSGRYLLIALALHALVLFYPIRITLEQLDAPPPGPVQVQLKESIAAPRVIPPSPPEKPATRQAPPRPKMPSTAQPVIALAPEQASAPATFFVPAPPSPPTPAAAQAAAPPSAAAVAVTAPRFNAAYLHNPEPKYPSISRRMGEEGKVLLKVRVTPDGLAAAVSIDKSSGYERLDESARDTVTRWRFVPARRGDEAIEATVIVPIVFRLDN